MPDQLTDDERELLAKHRAAKAKSKRTVTVRGKHDDADYEFTLDGDDADRVIARHSSLWADEEEEPEADGDDTDGDDDTVAPAKPGRRTAAQPAAHRKTAYFRK